MPQHRIVQQLCTFLIFTQCVLGLTTLLTPPITIVSYEVGLGPRNIKCRATIVPGDNLVMQKNGNTIAILVAPNLENIILSPTSTYSSSMKLEKSEIQPTNPPSVDVALVYTIAVVTRSHSGIYKCELDVESAIYNVTVEGPPYDVILTSAPSIDVRLKRIPAYDLNKFPDSHAVYEAKVNTAANGNIMLTADALGNPTARVSWYQKEDGEHQWTWAGNGTSIRLERDAEILNSTLYTASAYNDFGKFNVTVYMAIEYPPRSPTVIDPDLYPLQGGAVMSGCSFDAKPPASVFYVKENPETYQWDKVKNSTDGYFRLSNVQLERDVGIYRCIGSNMYGNVSGIINVHGKPKSALISILTIYSKSVDIKITAYCATNVMFEVNCITVDENGVIKNMTNIYYSSATAGELPIIEEEIGITNLAPNVAYTMSVVVQNEYGHIQATKVNFTTEDEGLTRPSITSTEAKSQPDVNTSAKLTSSILLIVTALVTML